MADKLFWLGKGVLRFSDGTFAKKGDSVDPNKVNKTVLSRLLATKQLGVSKDRALAIEAEKAEKKTPKKKEVKNGESS